jgi:flagellar hook-length control protein FliK
MIPFSMTQLGLPMSSSGLPGAPGLDPAGLGEAQQALFSSLLGEHFSQISPEVLQAALASATGEGLPIDGNALPLASDAVPLMQGLMPEALPIPGMTTSRLELAPIGLELRPEASLARWVERGVSGPRMPNLPGQLAPPLGELPAGLFEINDTSSRIANQGPATMLATPDAGTLGARPALPAVDVPVARPGWDQSLGQRVVWMVEGRQETAEIQLNPPHLGPLRVRVELNGDQASVSFASSHVLVRDAVESAVPRLREMLEASGLNLANVDVSEHGGSQRQRDGAESSRPGPGDAKEPSHGAPIAATAGSSSGTGLVDYYA